MLVDHCQTVPSRKKTKEAPDVSGLVLVVQASNRKVVEKCFFFATQKLILLKMVGTQRLRLVSVQCPITLLEKDEVFIRETSRLR